MSGLCVIKDCPDSPRPALSPSSFAQSQMRHRSRQIDPDRAFDRKWLQNNAAARAPDQNIGAEAGSECNVSARSDVASAHGAGADLRILGKNGPGQNAASGNAEVKANPPDPSRVEIAHGRSPRIEYATQRLGRSDKEPNSRSGGAQEPSDPEYLTLRRRCGGAGKHG